jgi:hypothetical protein
MLDRKALIVGINHYQMPGNDLEAAIADAVAIRDLLAIHEDGTPNYECRTLLDTTEDGQPINRSSLREACEELFSTGFEGDILLYFSGHGVLTQFGGYLVTNDAKKSDWGVPMLEIINMANRSKARSILLILDCCHSGDIANPSLLNNGGSDPLALLRENVTAMAASRASEASVEAGGHGLFTAAVIDALEGGAADHMGWVTAPSIYAYVQRRFDAGSQRPVYKSHMTGIPLVRQCAPLIDRLKLRKLVGIFPSQHYKFVLDPEHEPEDEYGNMHQPIKQEKIDIAHLFKEYRDSGLLKASIAGEQLYWTARRNHSVELTPRGREYWRLVQPGLIKVRYN